MIKCISFDLQGTITEADYCDSFWIQILPDKYAQKYNISLDEAKKEIERHYEKDKIYDIKYYDDSYWSNVLNIDVLDELKKLNKKPKINNKFINFIKSIVIQKIIISTTTNLFIDAELGEEKNNFDKIYSCVDYFNIGGKRPEVFTNIAKELNIKTSEMLHIGDNYIMDVTNAKEAGVNTIHFTGNTEETISEIKKFMEV